MLRVLLVDDDPNCVHAVLSALKESGVEVISHLANSIELYDAVKTFAPDVVIVDTDSPSRDALEHIALISRDAPKPVVMFASEEKTKKRFQGRIILWARKLARSNKHAPNELG
jgi:two-component system, response regulator / RNA-binding antiterminator